MILLSVSAVSQEFEWLSPSSQPGGEQRKAGCGRRGLSTTFALPVAWRHCSSDADLGDHQPARAPRLAVAPSAL
jgi:hypothetical protein